MTYLKALAGRLLANPVVNRTLHTAWQAALGALVAALFQTHGDMKLAVTVAVAAFAASIKNTLVKPTS